MSTINYFEDNGSVYSNNAAITGGAIYSENTKINITNCNFTDNFALYGGNFYLVNTPSISITNTTSQSNMALYSGGFAFIIDNLPSSQFATFLN